MQTNDVGVMNYIYYFTNSCDFMASKYYFYIDGIFLPNKIEYQLLKQISL